MPENGSDLETIARELQMLDQKLSATSSQTAFASSIFPTNSSLSFFELTALLPTHEAAIEERLESAWQLNGDSAITQATCLHLEIRKLLEQGLRCCQAPAAPIVAVLGLLNAGKSSLVSTYLSGPNRRRILVGSGNAQGTHRFVLWLPQSWRNDTAIWGSIQERLQTVFGCESEPLSSNAEEAMAQYNDTTSRRFVDSSGVERFRATIEIPLIATDPELDRWGLALMDCPDVQTGFLPNSPNAPTETVTSRSDVPEMFHEKSQSIAAARLAVLANASPVCSAFIVVLPANAMHDQTVSRLLRVLAERMPNVKQYLAVNRVPRRYLCSEIHSDLDELYGTHAVDRQYMAYSFDGPQQRERLPPSPLGLNAEPDSPLPLFFRIDKDQIPQPPSPIADEDWLLNIGSQLDKRSLFVDALASTTSRLRSHVRDAISQSQAFVRKTQAITETLQTTVANACLDFSMEDSSSASSSKIRLQVSRQIVQQVSQSLERTAPWWAMPSRWTARLAESGKESVISATTWLQIPKWFTGKTESIGRWIRDRWTSGQSGKIVTADLLVHHLQQRDRRGYLRLDEGAADYSAQKQRMHDACQRAIDRFQKESLIQLDDSQLDEFTTKMWSDMPMSKRLLTGFAPAGILFAPLLAVMMVPLDFGGSAVLIFASMKELLLAGAAGVGFVMASPDSMPKIAESEAAWQQLGDLYAVLCDELGLKRPSEAKLPKVGNGVVARQIPVSRIPEPIVANERTARTEQTACVPTLYQLHPHSVASIEESLLRLV